MKRNVSRFVFSMSLLIVFAWPAGAQQAAQGLSIVSAGPVGEIADLAQANEIRVIFSAPMVVLGRIPQPGTAPFVAIRSAIAGTFRWSGTTISAPRPVAATVAAASARRAGQSSPGSACQTAWAERRAARRIDFHFEEPVDVMIDGEVMTLNCQTLDVLPSALRVVV